MKFLTPLRYPGGKSGLGPWIAHVMRANQISGGHYTEPYAGGSGAALYLLLNGYVKTITINDYDPLIYSFWKSVLEHTDELIYLIEKTPVTMNTWLHQRDVANLQEGASELSLGFSAFFLNRTNRSGIIKGGAIGGIDQNGNYKIDARYNKRDLIKRIEAIALQSSQIEILNLDALDLIKMHCKTKQHSSLIYLDPPYYNKGSQLYRNFYNKEDHAQIAKAISKIKTPWLVTYDNCPEIKALYRQEKSTEFSLTYSTNLARPSATELLIYGNLKLPREPEIKKTIKPYPKNWDAAA